MQLPWRSHCWSNKWMRQMRCSLILNPISYPMALGAPVSRAWCGGRFDKNGATPNGILHPSVYSGSPASCTFVTDWQFVSHIAVWPSSGISADDEERIACCCYCCSNDLHMVTSVSANTFFRAGRLHSIHSVGWPAAELSGTLFSVMTGLIGCSNGATREFLNCGKVVWTSAVGL